MSFIVVSRSFYSCLELQRTTPFAMERNPAILDAILAPLCDVNPFLRCRSVHDTTNYADDDKPIRKVAKHPRINQ